jgi:hypothetical protein
MPNCKTTLSTTTGNLIVGVSAHKQCLSLARSQSDLNESSLALSFIEEHQLKKKNEILFLIFDYRHQESEPNATLYNNAEHNNVKFNCRCVCT